jgi:hypothetical protein
MQGHHLIALTLSVALVAGCRSERPVTAPVPLATADNTVEGTVVGDDRTAMEAAIDTGPSSAPPPDAAPTHGGAVVLAPNAPDSYVVKRGDTLWGIAKVFLRDPWFWPEIWQVNKQIQNPHLIYPGDTLRLVYIDGQPRITLQRGMVERGNSARVEPRVRSEPLEAAVTTIPYGAVAAFMSKPSVLSKEQIKGAPYLFATRDDHVALADGDTVYARGFTTPAQMGMHYNVVRVGDALRDPDDNRIVGYDGIFTASARVTRLGDPTTLIMTESARETELGDKLFAVINRGARDGLAPGNVLAVLEVGGSQRDTLNRGYLGGMSRLRAKKVQLPDERTGTFMVFKTFDRMSYGLIMEAKNIIHVSDRVENP